MVERRACRLDGLGAGEPALLLPPGWCANRTVFRRLAPFLAARRRVLALDWRGHGGSDASSGDFGEEGLLEDALAVVASSAFATFLVRKLDARTHFPVIEAPDALAAEILAG